MKNFLLFFCVPFCTFLLGLWLYCNVTIVSVYVPPHKMIVQDTTKPTRIGDSVYYFDLKEIITRGHYEPQLKWKE